MAQEGDSGEKTEAPTGKRIAESRSQGQVAVSTDMSNVCGITGAFVALNFIAPKLWEDLIVVLKGGLTFNFANGRLTEKIVHDQLINLILLLLPELMFVMFIAAICGAGCTVLQTKFLWSNKLLKPKFSHLNPLTGLKRIVSINNVVNVVKALVKLAIIVPISYTAFFELFPMFMGLMEMPISELLPATAFAASHVFWRIISWLLLLAILDLIWQKWRNYRKMKMSKQEIKDEKKAMEGDESTRRRIIAMGLEKARKRMFDAVPTADVIVTNPTHIAIALSYSMKKGTAPKVVAKGKGHIAARIREIAKKNKIPIVERKPLAQALFKTCEVGHEIPYELFKAVAEILAYVYRLRGKIPTRAKSANTNNGGKGQQSSRG